MNMRIEESKERMIGIGMETKYLKTNNQKTEKYVRKLYQKQLQ